MGTRQWAMTVRRRALALLALAGVVLSISLAAPAVAAPASDASATSTGLARASALSGSSFNAGYIIADANFYQKSAMSQKQIQAFLESKVNCANSNCLANLFAKTEKRANDRNICLGYKPDSDAKERASTIIYKVQQSCGISARVLLVTLQKEQGLIRKAAPRTGELNAAMGYRCSDTSPCVNESAGFFRQIYGAAWQFRRYSFPDLWGNFHIGTYSIGYNLPSSGCGAKTVKIRNHATAALYNYTPYTPNAGALKNLRGTAPCGSYGNRNFWVFYNDWFGSPLAGAGEAAIDNAYTAYGGESSDLGAQITTSSCGLRSASCSKEYEHGIITWTTADGAVIVAGAIGDYYLAKGGPLGSLGFPVKDAVPVDAGANGDGLNQPFKKGFVSSSVAGTFSMTGHYRTTHGGLGGVAGPMGWPTGDKTCSLPRGACVQPFQHGSILSATSAARSYAVVDPAIVEYWNAAGGAAGALGVPTGNATDVAGGVTQMFAGGLVAAGPDGTFTIIGPLRSGHAARGGPAGTLGWPTAERTCGLDSGACSQSFQGGVLYASSTVVGAVTVPGIVTYHASKGGGAGSLGIPLKDAVPVSTGANGKGHNQPFTKGFVSSSSNGTFSLTGAIRVAHGKQGGVAGPMGWPLADRVCAPVDGCSQEFQGGTIFDSGESAASVGYEPIADYYESKGGPGGSLGDPVKAAVPVADTGNGAGYNQPFTKAFVSSSANGTFSLTGAIRVAHGKQGGVAGPLGWPLADQVCVPNAGCSQQFQHGTIFSTGEVAGPISYQPIAEYYESKGGASGSLGVPMKDAVPVADTGNGAGYNQPFTKAFVSSSSHGTFSLTGAIRTAHGKLGGVAGPMGWPLAEQVCGLPANGCSQEFQHGTITADSAGTHVVYN